MGPKIELTREEAFAQGLKPELETDKVARGDVVRTQGGAKGMFVGVGRADVTWMCYDPARFMRACAAFDRTHFGSVVELDR